MKPPLVEIPWEVAVKLFRVQLTNHLINEKKMSREEASKYLDDHLNTYSITLNDAMNELTKVYGWS